MITPRPFMVRLRLDKKLIKTEGYVTLLSVLVVGAVGLAITVSLVLLGLGASQSSLSLEKSAQAKSLANACAEQALQEVRNDINLSGSGNLSLTQGSCSFTVANTGSESRLIIASGQAGKAVRKVKLNIDQINPQINILSWQELADF